MAADPPAPPVAVDPPAKTADMAPAPAPPAADASPAADTTPPPAAASADPAPAEPKVAKAEPPKASHPTSTTTERFAVQLGSWQVEATAHKVVDALGAKGINVSMTRVNDAGGRTWYVVRSGDVTSADEANSLRDSIKQAGPSDIAPVVVRVRTSHGHAA
jgi:DedD protein